MLSKTELLVTGAAGQIAGVLIPHLANRYDLVLTDIHEPANRHHPFIKADITDLKALRTVCTGINTVLHLAADPRDIAPWESLLPNNIIGAYNIFQAAHEASCQRLIFASSGHVVSGYPNEIQVHPSMPVRPANLYGATKAWGEAVARFYADQKGLSCICLRLGWVQAHDSHVIQPDAPALDQILTHEDLTRLIVASIEAPAELRFGIFHGISDNRWKRFDISDARTTLGYQPEDDAFDLAPLVMPKLKRYFWRRVKRRFKRQPNN